jgi:hypothetical protein
LLNRAKLIKRTQFLNVVLILRKMNPRSIQERRRNKKEEEKIWKKNIIMEQKIRLAQASCNLDKRYLKEV